MYLPIRTSDTSAKPSADRPCLTVMPCGSLTTGFGVSITWAISLGIGSPLVSRLGWKQGLADQSVVRGEVALARLGDDLAGQRRRVRLLVPARGREPVANELFVIGVRRDAHLVGRGVPVSRAVGRERLVDQDHLVVQLPELELRVGKDQAAAETKIGGVLVQLQAGVAQLGREVVAKLLFQLREADVLVVAGLGFRRG